MRKQKENWWKIEANMCTSVILELKSFSGIVPDN